MTPSPRDVIDAYLAAAQRGAWETAAAFLAPDLRLRIPGRSSFAGEHRGREAAMRYIEHARSLSSEHEVEVELIDTLVGDERVALMVREWLHLKSGTVEVNRVNVYRVVGGQIVEVAIYEADQYTVDELFA
jgi:uncharacterized protein